MVYFAPDPIGEFRLSQELDDAYWIPLHQLDHLVPAHPPPLLQPAGVFGGQPALAGPRPPLADREAALGLQQGEPHRHQPEESMNTASDAGDGDRRPVRERLVGQVEDRHRQVP